MNTSTSPLKHALLLILPLSLSSCSHYYYMPNMQQLPLLREKGEVRLAYASSRESANLDAEVNGHEFQASGAVTDKVGVMLNSASFTSPWSEGKGRLIEVGAGRFAALGPHWTAEACAGIGRGEVVYSGEQTALWRLFAQPSIGYASRNFDFAITTRFNYLDFDSPRLTTVYPLRSEESDAALENQAAHGRFLVEPGFVLRAGTRTVKLQIQYVHSSNLSRPLPMLEDNISIGLHLNINNGFKKHERIPKYSF